MKFYTVLRLRQREKGRGHPFDFAQDRLHAKPAMKYQFIEEYRQEYPVTMMCRVLKVARNGSCQWRKRPLSKRKVADLV